MTLVDICIIVVLTAVLLMVDLIVFIKLFVPMWFGAKLQMYRIMTESVAKAMEENKKKSSEEMLGKFQDALNKIEDLKKHQ